MSGSLDRGGRSDQRQRRALQRLAFSPSNAIGNTPIGASGGLVYTSGNLGIKLASASGLALGVGGLTIDPDTNSGLQLAAGGISIKLDGTSLTLGTNGLSVTAPEGQWSVTAIKTSAYAAVIGELVRCNPSGGIFTVTLPTAVGVAGRKIALKNTTTSTNAITVATTSSQTIDGASTSTLNTSRLFRMFVSDGANWMVT